MHLNLDDCARVEAIPEQDVLCKIATNSILLTYRRAGDATEYTGRSKDYEGQAGTILISPAERLRRLHPRHSLPKNDARAAPRQGAQLGTTWGSAHTKETRSPFPVLVLGYWLRFFHTLWFWQALQWKPEVIFVYDFVWKSGRL